MKATATAGALHTALSQAAMAMFKNRNVAALNVRVIAGGGVLSIAYDGMASITSDVAAIVGEPGECAISAERLTALVGKFPAAAEISISITERGALVTYNNSGFRLAVLPLAELPARLAVTDPTGTVAITGEDLVTLLAPLPAAPATPDRPYLRGLFWRSAEGKLVAVATDGFQLIRTSVEAGMFSPTQDLIVPREQAAVLLKIARRAKFDAVTLRRNNRLLEVSAPGFVFTTQLLDYAYPDVTRILPQPSTRAATCERSALADAVARLVAVADDGDKAVVVLNWWGTSKQVFVSLADQFEDGHDVIDAVTEGEGKAGIVARLLAEILRDFPNERLRLEDAGEQWPFIIRHGDKTAAITRYRTRASAQAA